MVAKQRLASGSVANRQSCSAGWELPPMRRVQEAPFYEKFGTPAQRTLLKQPQRLWSQERLGPSRCSPSDVPSHHRPFRRFQAQWLNVHVDFPLLQRIALPIAIGSVRYPGIKIHDTRVRKVFQ